MQLMQCSVFALLLTGTVQAQFVLEHEGRVIRHSSGTMVRETASPIREIGQVSLDGTDVAWWTDGAAQPYFAVVRGGQVTVKQAKKDIYVQSWSFDPAGQEPAFAPALTASVDNRAWLVQFHTQPLVAYRDALDRLGANVRKYVAHQAFLVEVEPGDVDAIRRLPFVRAVIPYHPALKLAPAIVPTALQAAGGPQRYNVLLHDRSSTRKVGLARAIVEGGGTVHLVETGGLLVDATLDPALLRAVAARPEILAIDRWAPVAYDLDHARSLSGVDMVGSTFGMTGQGVRGEIWDSGIRQTHVDFQSPRILFQTTVSGFQNHGTGTFGIAFGSGVGDPAYRGFLPDAQGIFADTDFLDRFAQTAELLEPPYEAVFQSNSWRRGSSTEYNAFSFQVDDVLFQLDIVVTQSQSNFGTRTSGPEAWAKNVISVGGVQTQGTVMLDDDCWCDGASIGPAADGRIKPDLVHVYDGVMAPDNANDTAYDPFCCTSGATPMVAGSFGLLFQAWHEGFFGAVKGATVFQSRPRPATARALLINTARRYPFDGPGADLERNHQGWGMPNLETLLSRADRMFIVDESDVLTNLESVSYDVEVLPGEDRLWVTMVYADPPAVPNSDQHRVNDLTLRVVSPNDVEYWGNHGLLDSNESTPGGSADTLNTVENVFVSDPAPGTWTIEVIASEINEDGRLETPELDADFALVVNGVLDTSCNGKLLGDANCDGLVTAGDINAFVLALLDPAGYAITHPGCNRICSSDFNDDQAVTVSDINGFVTLLTGG